MDDKTPLLQDEEIKKHRAPSASQSKHYGFPIVLLATFSIFIVLATVRINAGLFRENKSNLLAENDQIHGEVVLSDFDNINPSPDLVWHSCFGEFKCARLTVPMDWSAPDTSSTVHIALILIPGTGPISRSPLLLNPGGPGTSGVAFARFSSRPLRSIVGLDQDIIGFDPRGVGASTPRIDCFGYPYNPYNFDPNRGLTDQEKTQGSWRRLQFQLAGTSLPLIDDDSDLDEYQRWETRTQAAGVACQFSDTVYGSRSILKHASTPSVAHDMLRIVEKWDEWRAEEIGHEEDRKIDEAKDVKGKLVYWGFGYGSLLGATFAAMFPDKVGRVVLDGVVDADIYVRPVWTKSIVATDAIVAKFMTYCHAAKEQCPLYVSGDTPDDISKRFYSIKDAIKQHPLAGMHPVYKIPLTYDHQSLQKAIFQSLYKPLWSFPLLASVMARFAEYGSGAFKYSAPNEFYDVSPYPYCSANYIERWFDSKDAATAIMCSDKRYPLAQPLSVLREYYKNMSLTSSLADVWMTDMIRCSHWPIKTTDPPMNWSLPSHQHNPSSSVATFIFPSHHHPLNTSFPLLFVSNTLDPITPIQGGFKMARKFVDAALLEIKQEGHSSTATLSLCAIKKIGEYLREGKTLPPPKGSFDDRNWEICEADEYPWKPWSGASPNGKKLGAREIQLGHAWKELQEAVMNSKEFMRHGPWGLAMPVDMQPWI